MASENKEKWIGFDMDECMAQLGTFYYFLVGMDPAIFPGIIAELAETEKSAKTWFLRPAFRILLPVLGKAYQDGILTGVFIYSNNGNQIMVDFVGDLMNAIAGVDLVSNRLSAEFPEKRRGAAYSKNLEFVQTYISPTINNTNLLFFDDLPNHQIASQIKNYIQVVPYNNQMSIEYLEMVFDLYIKHFSENFKKYNLLDRAGKHELIDISERDKLLVPPHNKWIDEELGIFEHVIQTFLFKKANPSRVIRRTRRGRKKISIKFRKCLR